MDTDAHSVNERIKDKHREFTNYHQRFEMLEKAGTTNEKKAGNYAMMMNKSDLRELLERTTLEGAWQDAEEGAAIYASSYATEEEYVEQCWSS